MTGKHSKDQQNSGPFILTWNVQIDRNPKMDSTKPMDKVYDHVYEDVGSTTEWVKEAGIDSLHVHLTGDFINSFFIFWFGSFVLVYNLMFALEGVCSSCSPHSSMSRMATQTLKQVKERENRITGCLCWF